MASMTGNSKRIDGRRRLDRFWPEPASKLGLPDRGKRGAFLVANADPFNIAAANRVG